MTNQKGVTFIELSISIGIMSVVLAALFTLFSSACAATTAANSKLFITTQEKSVLKQLKNQFDEMQSIANLPGTPEEITAEQKTPGENFPLQDAKQTLEYINAKGEKHTLCVLNSQLLLKSPDGTEITQSEPCIRKMFFSSSLKDRRYIYVYISFYDPSNLKTKNDASKDYIYQGIFFARNLQRT